MGAPPPTGGGRGGQEPGEDSAVPGPPTPGRCPWNAPAGVTLPLCAMARKQLGPFPTHRAGGMPANGFAPTEDASQVPLAQRRADVSKAASTLPDICACPHSPSALCSLILQVVVTALLPLQRRQTNAVFRTDEPPCCVFPAQCEDGSVRTQASLGPRNATVPSSSALFSA